jgi:hypothetical protein
LGFINLKKVVMTMMRLVMEAVMVFAVVGILVFMMKISAKEENTDELLRENSDEDNEDSGRP